MDIEEYIAQFDDIVKERLWELRSYIIDTVPECTEKISWGVPTYYLKKYLLQIAAYKKYIGFYTSPKTLEYFKDELKNYQTNHKNTVHFPHDRELPKALIIKMIKYCVDEIQEGTEKIRTSEKI